MRGLFSNATVHKYGYYYLILSERTMEELSE